MVTRIRQLLDWQQLSPTQFADLIGVGRPVVSHILSERNKPSLEVVQRIIAAFPAVSLPWLLTGAGEMLAEAIIGATNGSAAASSTPKGPTPAENARLPEPQRDAIPTQPITPVPAPPAPALASPAASAFRRTTAARPAPARFMVRQTPLATTPPAPTAPPTPSTAAAEASAEAVPTVPATAQAGAGFLATAAAVVAPVAAAQLPVAGAAAPQASDDTAAMAAFLSEPGKAIRRIVIFYRDGSFADYRPEA